MSRASSGSASSGSVRSTRVFGSGSSAYSSTRSTRGSPLRPYDPEIGRRSRRSLFPGGAVAAAVVRYMGRSAARATRSVKKRSFAFNGVPSMRSTQGAFVVTHRECVGPMSTPALNVDATLGVTNAQLGTGGANPAVTGVTPVPYQAVVDGANARPVIGSLRVNGNNTAEALGGYLIYPTNASLFPWLASIATKFEQYKWRHINVQYVSSIADGTTVLNLGNIMSYIDYDPNQNVAPATVGQFMNQAGAVTSKPTQSFQMGVQSSHNPFELKWTRQAAAGAVVAAADPRMYADGRLYISGDNLPLNTSVGYLWIEYSIELYKPQV